MVMDFFSLSVKLRVRIDGPMTELTKVLIKSKGSLEAKPLHHCKAGAIRKTEPLVGIALEHLPCFPLIGRCHPNKRNHLMFE